MSESENCAEQREEPTELEEAGGPEVRRFKMGFVFSIYPRTPMFNTPQTFTTTIAPVPCLRISGFWLCETFTRSVLKWVLELVS